MIVTVNLTLAIICFLDQCHPALVGDTTPIGQYQLVQRKVLEPGYDGLVLKFKEDHDGWYAIHKVWTLDTKQDRKQLLKSNNSADRRRVSNGCINIEPIVFDQLKSCCSRATLIIEP